MLTAGQLLKQVRVTKSLSLDLISAQTNIKKEYLKAIENDDYEKLPSDISADGFVGVYAEFLGVDKNRALALKRRAMLNAKPVEKMPAGKGAGKNMRDWHKLSGIAALVVLVTAVLVYFAFQLVAFQRAPLLEVFKPDKDMTVHTATIDVEGLVDKDAVVTLNDAELEVRTNGFFSTRYTLNEGTNILVFKATRKSNQRTSTQIIRKVVFDNPDHQENATPRANEPESPEPPKAQPGTLTIEATGPVWLTVNIDGTEQFTGTMQEGDKQTFEPTKEAVISTARPGALKVDWQGDELSLHAGDNTCNIDGNDISCQ